MEAVLQFLTGDIGRFALTLAGGALMKAAPGFKNRAIPFVTLLTNILLALLSGLVPGQAQAQDVMPHIGGSGALAFLGNGLLHGLFSWASATGVHSGSKNIRQWVKIGGGLAATIQEQQKRG